MTAASACLQAGGDCRWLRWAVQLQDTMDALFWDDKGGEQRLKCEPCQCCGMLGRQRHRLIALSVLCSA